MPRTRSGARTRGKVVRGGRSPAAGRPAGGWPTDIPSGSSRGTPAYLLRERGRTYPLARAGGRGPRVGRYSVSLGTFERLVLPRLDPAAGALFVVDEIEKMELLSESFERALRILLDGDRVLLASVAERGPPLVEEVNRRRDALLIRVNPATRGAIPSRLAAVVRQALGPAIPPRS